MKNIIKKLLILVCLLGLVNANTLQAQAIDHTFTYQGELLDNGAPANGLYDINIQGYTNLTGDPSWGGLSEHFNVTVTNGLFTIEGVDLGIATLDGLDLYLEVRVRMGGGNPVYETLSPRQKLSSVPYATALTKGNASEGQVYTFTGDKWQASINNHTTYTAGTGISITGTTINNTNNSITSLDDLSDATLNSQFNNLSIVSTLPNNTGSSNMAIGVSTLNENIDGSANLAIGHNSLSSNVSGNNNIAIGLSALSSNTSSNNTAVGYNAGSVGGGEGSVYLGYSAGKFSNQSNKLFIENSSSSEPLIGGDFFTDEVVINGKLGIGIASPDEKIHVKGALFEKIKVESTESGATASLVLKTNAGNFDNFVIEKFGPTSPTTSAGIPLAGVSRISAGANAGPLLLQVIPSDPMYFVTNNVLQMTLESDGDFKLEQKLTAPDSGDADMKAYIYGSTLTSAGAVNVNRSSDGFVIARQAAGNYRVTFDTSPGNIYVVNVDVIGSAPKFTTISRLSDYFDVFIWDLSGTKVDAIFNFVVFKK